MAGVPTGKRTKETGFLKTFPSELDDAAVQRLMLEVKSPDNTFKDFNTRDLKVLAQLISALKFEAGDKIVSRGETASFLGIVMKGTFASLCEDGSHVALRRGEMIGDIEFFEPGSLRKSDIVAATQGVVGVLTFEDLKLVGLLSVDLHMRLMQALSVSSIRKLRAGTQTGGGGTSSTSATPKTRSRRSSLTARETTSLLGQASHETPSASPTLERQGNSESVSDETPQTTLSPSELDDEAAVASVVAAAAASSEDPSTGRTALSSPAAHGGRRLEPTDPSLELIFRTRMRKNSSTKPRRLEADAFGMVDVQVKDASASSSSSSTAAGAGANTVFPPLVANASNTGPSSNRSSINGGVAQLGGASGSPPASAGSLERVSSLAGGGSGGGVGGATDKSNINYVLYALRNKLARQEEDLDDREHQIASLQLDVKLANEALVKQIDLASDLESKCQGYAASLKSADERAMQSESELHAARIELTRKDGLLEQAEAERRALVDSTSQTLANMHAKLVEHGEIMDDANGNSTGTGSSSGATTRGDATAVSSPSAPQRPLGGGGGVGGGHQREPSSLPSGLGFYTPQPIRSSKYTSSSFGSGRDRPTVGASGIVVSSHLAEYASQYESMILKLKGRIGDQERQLIALTKWRTRAQEFANTWDVERTRLKDRVKAGLLEAEQLKTQKDSYKILLKVSLIKLHMAHSAVRRQLRAVYKKLVSQTTDLMIEQKFSGGIKGVPIAARSQSVQNENAEELLVRTQQKMNEEPWALIGGGGAGGSGGGSGSVNGGGGSGSRIVAGGNGRVVRPPPLRSLVESVDDELSRLITANASLLASKQHAFETASSFFQRNIELTQTVAGQDADALKEKDHARQLERRLHAAESQVTSLQASLAALESTHRAKLHEVQLTRAQNAGEVRARKQEVAGLFERHVSLQRKLREGEIALVELERKERKLQEKNDALTADQRRLVLAVAQAKEIEAAIAQGNGHQYSLLLAAQSNAHSQSRRTLGGGGAFLSSAPSTTHLGPLVASAGSASHRSLRLSSPPTSNGATHNFTSSSSPSLVAFPSPPTTSAGGFQATMPHHSSGTQLGSTASDSSLALPSMASATHTLPGGVPVLATIRARSQVPLAPPGLTPQQWAALATLPPQLMPLTARPAPPLPSQPRRTHAASTGSLTAREERTVSDGRRQQTSQSMKAALQRDSLDRALARAAKSGLGRGFASGSAKQLKSSDSSQLIAHHSDQAESKESESDAPSSPPTMPHTYSLKEAMQAKADGDAGAQQG